MKRDKLTTEELQAKRERDAYIATRGGKGRARVQIKRSVIVTENDGKRVSGNAIVIRPKTFTRDSIKSLNHFCSQRRIKLSPIESVTHRPPGIAEDVTRAISYLAIGPVASLKELSEHKYVGLGNWQFTTTVRVSGQTTLARAPRASMKDEDIPPHPHKTANEEFDTQ